MYFDCRGWRDTVRETLNSRGVNLETGQGDENEERDVKGYFLPGNQFWKQRERSGRKSVFETPDDLKDAAFSYFEWADSNPLWEMKAFASGVVVRLPKIRAMTIEGLCTYIGLSRRSWGYYRERDDYAEACELIEDIMREQKFTGAAAGLLNPAIIARDLGLADRKELDASVTVEVVDSFDEDQDS